MRRRSSHEVRKPSRGQGQPENLSKLVKELPSERSVVITKNGRPCAVLFSVTEETDLENVMLAQRKDLWQLLDRAHKEGKKKGFTELEDVPD